MRIVQDCSDKVYRLLRDAWAEEKRWHLPDEPHAEGPQLSFDDLDIFCLMLSDDKVVEATLNELCPPETGSVVRRLREAFRQVWPGTW